MSKEQIRQEIDKIHKIANIVNTESTLTQTLHKTHPGYINLSKSEIINNITQDHIKSHINLQTLEKAYNIVLNPGIYKSIYDLTGRYSLLTERKGQIALYDVKTKHLFFDINIDERINDAIFLHNELFVAVAQRKNLYIYDKKGREVHCIRKIKKVKKLDFLQYHFLLVSLSDNNELCYYDTSIGKIIATIDTKETHTCITKNQTDGVIYLGSENGSVSLWTPNEKNYVAKIMCHESMVCDVQVERFGNFMVTNGNDRQIKIWDVRKLFEPCNVINTESICRNLKLSQNNILATTHRDKVVLYKDIDKVKENENEHLALLEKFGGRILTSLDFCPFEDVLSVGHNRGVSNMIVPGAGDPNFDSFEESPFRSKHDRQEIEVRRLLEKVPYKLIHMKQSVGHLNDK